MKLDSDRLTTILFDYGNTLIEFTRAQIEALDRRLEEYLGMHFGPVSWERLRAGRSRDRLRPFEGDPPSYRENDRESMTTRMLRDLYGRDPDGNELAELLDFRRRIFVEVIQAPDYLGDLLERLRSRFRLGVLSNYPDGDGIRASIANIGIETHLETVVVSGDLGWVKPHPVAFESALEAMGARPEETVYVGDNWLADVQGARRAGLGSVHITQWETPDHHEPGAADLEPHATIEHLTELPGALGLR